MSAGETQRGESVQPATGQSGPRLRAGGSSSVGGLPQHRWQASLPCARHRPACANQAQAIQRMEGALKAGRRAPPHPALRPHLRRLGLLHTLVLHKGVPLAHLGGVVLRGGKPGRVH